MTRPPTKPPGKITGKPAAKPGTKAAAQRPLVAQPPSAAPATNPLGRTETSSTLPAAAPAPKFTPGPLPLRSRTPLTAETRVPGAVPGMTSTPQRGGQPDESLTLESFGSPPPAPPAAPAPSSPAPARKPAAAWSSPAPRTPPRVPRLDLSATSPDRVPPPAASVRQQPTTALAAPQPASARPEAGKKSSKAEKKPSEKTEAEKKPSRIRRFLGLNKAAVAPHNPASKASAPASSSVQEGTAPPLRSSLAPTQQPSTPAPGYGTGQVHILPGGGDLESVSSHPTPAPVSHEARASGSAGQGGAESANFPAGREWELVSVIGSPSPARADREISAPAQDIVPELIPTAPRGPLFGPIGGLRTERGGTADRGMGQGQHTTPSFSLIDPPRPAGSAPASGVAPSLTAPPAAIARTTTIDNPDDILADVHVPAQVSANPFGQLFHEGFRPQGAANLSPQPTPRDLRPARAEVVQPSAPQAIAPAKDSRHQSRTPATTTGGPRGGGDRFVADLDDELDERPQITTTDQPLVRRSGASAIRASREGVPAAEPHVERSRDAGTQVDIDKLGQLAQEEFNKLRADAKEARSTERGARKEAQDANTRAIKAEQKAAEAEEARKAAADALAAAEERIARAGVKREESATEIERLRKELDAANAKVKKADARVEQARKTLEEANTQIRDSRTRRKEIEAQLEQVTKEREDALAQLAQARSATPEVTDAPAEAGGPSALAEKVAKRFADTEVLVTSLNYHVQHLSDQLIEKVLKNRHSDSLAGEESLVEETPPPLPAEILKRIEDIKTHNHEIVILAEKANFNAEGLKRFNRHLKRVRRSIEELEIKIAKFRSTSSATTPSADLISGYKELVRDLRAVEHALDKAFTPIYDHFKDTSRTAHLRRLVHTESTHRNRDIIQCSALVTGVAEALRRRANGRDAPEQVERLAKEIEELKGVYAEAKQNLSEQERQLADEARAIVDEVAKSAQETTERANAREAAAERRAKRAEERAAEAQAAAASGTEAVRAELQAELDRTRAELATTKTGATEARRRAVAAETAARTATEALAQAETAKRALATVQAELASAIEDKKRAEQERAGAKAEGYAAVGKSKQAIAEAARKAREAIAAAEAKVEEAEGRAQVAASAEQTARDAAKVAIERAIAAEEHIFVVEASRKTTELYANQISARSAIVQSEALRRGDMVRVDAKIRVAAVTQATAKILAEKDKAVADAHAQVEEANTLARVAQERAEEAEETARLTTETARNKTEEAQREKEAAEAALKQVQEAQKAKAAAEARASKAERHATEVEAARAAAEQRATAAEKDKAAHARQARSVAEKAAKAEDAAKAELERARAQIATAKVEVEAAEAASAAAQARATAAEAARDAAVDERKRAYEAERTASLEAIGAQEQRVAAIERSEKADTARDAAVAALVATRANTQLVLSRAESAVRDNLVASEDLSRGTIHATRTEILAIQRRLDSAQAEARAENERATVAIREAQAAVVVAHAQATAATARAEAANRDKELAVEENKKAQQQKEEAELQLREALTSTKEQVAGAALRAEIAEQAARSAQASAQEAAKAEQVALRAKAEAERQLDDRKAEVEQLIVEKTKIEQRIAELDAHRIAAEEALKSTQHQLVEERRSARAQMAQVKTALDEEKRKSEAAARMAEFISRGAQEANARAEAAEEASRIADRIASEAQTAADNAHERARVATVREVEANIARRKAEEERGEALRQLTEGRALTIREQAAAADRVKAAEAAVLDAQSVATAATRAKEAASAEKEDAQRRLEEALGIAQARTAEAERLRADRDQLDKERAQAVAHIAETESILASTRAQVLQAQAALDEEKRNSEAAARRAESMSIDAKDANARAEAAEEASRIADRTASEAQAAADAANQQARLATERAAAADLARKQTEEEKEKALRELEEGRALTAQEKAAAETRVAAAEAAAIDARSAAEAATRAKEAVLAEKDGAQQRLEEALSIAQARTTEAKQFQAEKVEADQRAALAEAAARTAEAARAQAVAQEAAIRESSVQEIARANADKDAALASLSAERVTHQGEAVALSAKLSEAESVLGTVHTRADEAQRARLLAVADAELNKTSEAEAAARNVLVSDFARARISAALKALHAQRTATKTAHEQKAEVERVRDAAQTEVEQLTEAQTKAIRERDQAWAELTALARAGEVAAEMAPDTLVKETGKAFAQAEVEVATSYDRMEKLLAELKRGDPEDSSLDETLRLIKQRNRAIVRFAAQTGMPASELEQAKQELNRVRDAAKELQSKITRFRSSVSDETNKADLISGYIALEEALDEVERALATASRPIGNRFKIINEAFQCRREIVGVRSLRLQGSNRRMGFADAMAEAALRGAVQAEAGTSPRAGSGEDSDVSRISNAIARIQRLQSRNDTTREAEAKLVATEDDAVSRTSSTLAPVPPPPPGSAVVDRVAELRDVVEHAEPDTATLLARIKELEQVAQAGREAASALYEELAKSEAAAAEARAYAAAIRSAADAEIESARRYAGEVRRSTELKDAEIAKLKVTASRASTEKPAQPALEDYDDEVVNGVLKKLIDPNIGIIDCTAAKVFFGRNEGEALEQATKIIRDNFDAEKTKIVIPINTGETDEEESTHFVCAILDLVSSAEDSTPQINISYVDPLSGQMPKEMAGMLELALNQVFGIEVRTKFIYSETRIQCGNRGCGPFTTLLAPLVADGTVELKVEEGLELKGGSHHIPAHLHLRIAEGIFAPIPDLTQEKSKEFELSIRARDDGILGRPTVATGQADPVAVLTKFCSDAQEALLAASRGTRVAAAPDQVVVDDHVTKLTAEVEQLRSQLAEARAQIAQQGTGFDATVPARRQAASIEAEQPEAGSAEEHVTTPEDVRLDDEEPEATPRTQLGRAAEIGQALVARNKALEREANELRAQLGQVLKEQEEREPQPTPRTAFDQHALETAAHFNEQARVEIERLRKLLEKQTAEKGEERARADRLEARIKEIKPQLDARQDWEREVAKKLEDLETQVSMARRAEEAVLRRNKELSAEVSALKAAAVVADSTPRNPRPVIASTETQTSEAAASQEAQREFERAIQSARSEVDTAVRERDAARGDAEAAQEKAASLRSELSDATRQYQSYLAEDKRTLDRIYDEQAIAIEAVRTEAAASVAAVQAKAEAQISELRAKLTEQEGAIAAEQSARMQAETHARAAEDAARAQTERQERAAQEERGIARAEIARLSAIARETAANADRRLAEAVAATAAESARADNAEVRIKEIEAERDQVVRRMRDEANTAIEAGTRADRAQLDARTLATELERVRQELAEARIGIARLTADRDEGTRTRIADLEASISAQRERANAAEESLRAANISAEATAREFRAELTAVQDEAAAARAIIERRDVELATARAAVETIRAEAEETRTTLVAQTDARVAEAERKRSDAEASAATKAQSHAAAEARIAEIQAAADATSRKLAAVRARNEEQAAALERIQADAKASAEASAQAHRAQIAALEADVRNAKADVAAVRAELSVEQQRAAAKAAEVEEAHTARVVAERQLLAERGRADAATRDAIDARAAIETASGERDAAKRRADTTAEILAAARERITELEGADQRAKDAERDLASALAEAAASAAEASAANERLTTESSKVRAEAERDYDRQKAMLRTELDRARRGQHEAKIDSLKTQEEQRRRDIIQDERSRFSYISTYFTNSLARIKSPDQIRLAEALEARIKAAGGRLPSVETGQKHRPTPGEALRLSTELRKQIGLNRVEGIREQARTEVTRLETALEEAREEARKSTSASDEAKAALDARSKELATQLDTAKSAAQQAEDRAAEALREAADAEARAMAKAQAEAEIRIAAEQAQNAELRAALAAAQARRARASEARDDEVQTASETRDYAAQTDAIGPAKPIDHRPEVPAISRRGAATEPHTDAPLAPPIETPLVPPVPLRGALGHHPAARTAASGAMPAPPPAYSSVPMMYPPIPKVMGGHYPATRVAAVPPVTSGPAPFSMYPGAPQSMGHRPTGTAAAPFAPVPRGEPRPSYLDTPLAHPGAKPAAKSAIRRPDDETAPSAAAHAPRATTARDMPVYTADDLRKMSFEKLGEIYCELVQEEIKNRQKRGEKGLADFEPAFTPQLRGAAFTVDMRTSLTIEKYFTQWNHNSITGGVVYFMRENPEKRGTLIREIIAGMKPGKGASRS